MMTYECTGRHIFVMDVTGYLKAEKGFNVRCDWLHPLSVVGLSRGSVHPLVCVLEHARCCAPFSFRHGGALLHRMSFGMEHFSAPFVPISVPHAGHTG